MKRKRYAVATLWPILTFFMCSMTQAQGKSASGVAAPAASGKDTIVPLQIGDTIPEALWRLPLAVINHPEGKDTITLNEYRGKLILLDFWGIWCASCIHALPKLDSLQKQFPQTVAVLTSAQRDAETIGRFWAKNAYTKGLGIPSIADTQYLHRYFPHRIISHVVWISPDGLLASTTGTDYADFRTARHLLNGQRPDWKPKIDLAEFDYSAHLMSLTVPTDQLEHPRNGAPFFSALTGGRIGADQSAIFVADTARHTTRWKLMNVSLYDLILISHQLHSATFPANNIRWQVADKSRYSQAFSADYPDSWFRKNAYSYEYFGPGLISRDSVKQILAEDLRRYFPGLKTKLETSGTTSKPILTIQDESHTFPTDLP